MCLEDMTGIKEEFEQIAPFLAKPLGGVNLCSNLIPPELKNFQGLDINEQTEKVKGECRSPIFINPYLRSFRVFPAL